MFECPNCGGNLRFDIPSQQLACDFCHTFHDPYAVTKDHDAVEQDMYDVTVFTCPQCGGELMSTENSAAEFCTFCGRFHDLIRPDQQRKTTKLHHPI